MAGQGRAGRGMAWQDRTEHTPGKTVRQSQTQKPNLVVLCLLQQGEIQTYPIRPLHALPCLALPCHVHADGY